MITPGRTTFQAASGNITWSTDHDFLAGQQFGLGAYVMGYTLQAAEDIGPRVFVGDDFPNGFTDQIKAGLEDVYAQIAAQ